MKYFILLSFLLPSLVFGQVKIDDLTSRNGLSYEKGATVPFTGKAFAYFPSGDIQTVVEYKNGLPNGEIRSWTKKDVKQVEGFVDNGKRTGTWKLYFESGKLQKQSVYQNDMQNGEEIFWFENGNLKKSGNYVNGKLNGKYTWYFENGQKQQEGYFLNNKEDSIWTEWFENGKKKMVGHFKNYEKNGNWTWWDENGKITASKNYINGLLSVGKDNFDAYLEKMEFYLTQRNYIESLKNVELAEATITDKTETNAIFMGLVVYHSKCYSFFSHFKQAEKILLDAIGLSNNHSMIIQTSHLEKSTEKLNQVIKEITNKDNLKFQIGNHIALALCYNLLGDTISLKKEQQLIMEKGQMQDWIINISLELYKLAKERFDNYVILENINTTIAKEGVNEKLELEKAQYLVRNEKFEDAEIIVDKYLLANNKNLTALLLKSVIEMVSGNVEQMKIYEEKALAIDPNAFSSTKD